MKTKKIVIGAMAAAMLSLSVCSLAPAFAADGTVQISVGSANVKAGEKFKVDVSIKDIPSEGIQGCQFSLSFDSTIVTIDSVEAGSLLKSVTSDPASSALPSFNSSIDNKGGTMNLMWATSVDESAYLLKGEGVFCTITGTVASGAASGAKSDLKVVPTVRDNLPQSGVVNEDIDVGYTKNGEKVKYNIELKNGAVTVGDEQTTTKPTQTTTDQPQQGPGKYLKGDANCDGEVNIADATAIIQHLGNRDKYGLSEQGLINADVVGDDGVTGSDALQLQKLEAGMIDKL